MVDMLSPNKMLHVLSNHILKWNMHFIYMNWGEEREKNKLGILVLNM